MNVRDRWLSLWTDFSQARIWLPVEELADLADEDLLFGDIENCVSMQTKKLDMRQAVSRIYDTETEFIRYYFEPKVFQALAERGAVQLSFLFVHEWIWDFLPVERVNNSRLINWLLHSKQDEGWLWLRLNPNSNRLLG